MSVLTGYVPQLEKDESALPAQNKLTNEALKHYRPVFEIYNTKTGFPIKDANVGQNSMFLDSKGIIWMGTGSAASGMVRLDFSALHRNPNPLDVFIQSVRVNNTAIAWVDLMAAKNTPSSLGTITTPANVTDETLMFGKPLSPEERKAMRDGFGSIKFSGVEKFYYVPENPVVPHDLNTLTLDFAAIEPARPSNVLYQYMLEGYDKKWSQPSNDSWANYGNIFEGSYQFKVKAQSPDGVWSKPITYPFKVLPPWYRTWWAYLLYALSFSTILFSYIRWRTAKLRKEIERTENLYQAAERFVPKRFLQLLGREHFEDVQLGDSVQVKMTGMFADIRGFTTFSESLEPHKVSLFLNIYVRLYGSHHSTESGFCESVLRRWYFSVISGEFIRCC